LSNDTLDFVTPTSVFTMGRPKGSKNKAGHKAGGDRRSLCSSTTRKKNQVSISSFVTRGTESPESPCLQSVSSLNQDPPISNKNGDSVSSQAEVWEVESQKLKATREKLKEVMSHPSMKVVHEMEKKDDEGLDNYLSDDDEEEDNSESGGSSSSQSRERKKYKWSYLPPKGSVVSEYLTAIKDKVVKGTLPGFNLDHGQKWVPPQSDALSIGIGRRAVADRWYLGCIWVYVWMPLRQYSLHVHDNLHPCAFSAQNNTHSEGLYWWRPMFFIT
jgi:hypothetical protein